jgi:hypothetical protein
MCHEAERAMVDAFYDFDFFFKAAIVTLTTLGHLPVSYTCRSAVSFF